jgi:hypothetical protein
MYLIGWICEGHSRELPNTLGEKKSISVHDEFMNNHLKASGEASFNSYVVHAENESFDDRIKTNAIIEKDLLKTPIKI